MDGTRLERLTEQQRTCLRLVYSHLTSKEISPLLGIEPGSVDQHIKAAMRVLGVGDRRTAARILAEAEGREPAQPLVYQPSDIAPRPEPFTFERSIGSGAQASYKASGEVVREERQRFHLVSPGGAPTLPLPIGGTRPGDLNWLARLAWIFGIAIGVALAFGALVSAVEALARLTRG
ncbi:MAG TPA: helix-turn-helix transcriptional regulator [Allosphingosinicella sp.]|nr:helix-turn-helix transcriptional regulator [Allosphingosinicella sp.]